MTTDPNEHFSRLSDMPADQDGEGSKTLPRIVEAAESACTSNTSQLRVIFPFIKRLADTWRAGETQMSQGAKADLPLILIGVGVIFAALLGYFGGI